MNEDSKNKEFTDKEYLVRAQKMRDKLNSVSPSFCLAKWKMVSLHLTNGHTQSCYHPPAHKISLDGLAENAGQLHNTEVKIQERLQMRSGAQPPGCSYCWKVEAAGEHLSDRHYRSSEPWAAHEFDKISSADLNFDKSVNPSYVEVNFNQACNFKCIYCSPHLSSEWQKEIEKFGPFQLQNHNHNDIQELQKTGLMPLGIPNTENAYVSAFWSWWPQIYSQLKVFRMTGGEPLLDANTWKVLNYVSSHPKKDLELSVTTNLCPPKSEIFRKFVQQIRHLEAEGAIKQFLTYVSCDSYGVQAEYIRTGMNFMLLKSNVTTLLNETTHSSVNLINTFNILSVPKLKDYLGWILELREKFSYGQSQRIWFDLPILTHPAWLNIKLFAGTKWEKEIEECIDFMEKNVREDYDKSFKGFKPYEVLKLKRNLAIMKSGFTDFEKSLNKKNFIRFVDELDRRRGTMFVETFPELRDFYEENR